ncbi:MAG: class I SAM-dependent methyltransferase [Gammaproteobacteria bacterium]
MATEPSDFQVASRDIYSKPDVVAFYARQKTLYPAEQTIFRDYASLIANGRVLDIGVGGGRTTWFLAGTTAMYVGVDYAEPMVEACIENFRTVFPKARFEVADARDLSQLTVPGGYDFILFNGNGIDHLTEEHRDEVLRSIRTLCSERTVFCFSSHNLLWLLRKLPSSFGWSGIFDFLTVHIMRRMNRRVDLNRDTSIAVLNDLAHRGSKAAYVHPEIEITRVERAGFRVVRMLSDRDGLPVAMSPASARDCWLYYVCEPT